MTADREAIRSELLAMAAEDLAVRAELERSGALFEGYHPRMRAVHERNAVRLTAILDAHGWPGRTLVGDEAAEAAWLVLQHAIGNPALQRRGLALLTSAAAAHDVPPAQVATLDDRIRVSEGRPQRYGTQFDWDERGSVSPLPIEDDVNVDARRAEVGLRPLAEQVERMRRDAAAAGEHAPKDWHARQAEIRAWRRVTGWLD